MNLHHPNRKDPPPQGKQKKRPFFPQFRNSGAPMNFRLLSVLVIIALVFMVIGIRILSLTFGDRGGALNGAYQQRGIITDIGSTPLAFSEERYNLYYNPKAGPLEQEQIATITSVLGDKINTLQINEEIEENRTFLLARYVDKEATDRLIDMNMSGLLVDKTMFRNYPYNRLLSQTLGFVGHEGNGFYGLEYKYNDFLNHDLIPGYEKTLTLNLKVDFQRQIENLIRKAVKVNQADYGSIIVQEISTGRILGLANYPDFDLNHFEKYPNQAFVNRATSYLLEPGSIFKIFFASYLIEKFNPQLDEKKYTCKGYYELSNKEIIKCHGIHGEISLQDIIKYSCNSGIIQATEDLTAEEMYDFIRRLWVGEHHGIDLPGESRGLILKTKNWGIRTKATIPLGHGLALTPLHLINIFSALIGKGYLYRPRVARYLDEHQNGKLINRQEIEPEVITKIISEEVSRKIVDLLYYGTIKGSTGYSSRSTGFEQVFGKTATSQLANIDQGGYYTNRYHSMFAGGYPFNDPRYSILVVVSRPQKEYYGGKIAAPIFAQVVEALNQHYDLTEERNVERFKNLIQEDAPGDEIIEEFLTDKVPDFTGFPARKAIVLLEDFKRIQKARDINIRYQLKGSGYVKKQSPPPGTPVNKNLNIALIFE